MCIRDSFASILVEEDGVEKPKTKPDINKAIGIDLGIKEFAVCSNGKRFNNPKQLKKSLNKLKKEQKKLSKKKKGSNRKNKQRKKKKNKIKRVCFNG